jgi:hypothetical protein
MLGARSSVVESLERRRVAPRPRAEEKSSFSRPPLRGERVGEDYESHPGSLYEFDDASRDAISGSVWPFVTKQNR